MRISEISASELGGLGSIGLAQVPAQEPQYEEFDGLGDLGQPKEEPSTMTKVLVFGAAALFLFWAWGKFKGGAPRLAGMGRWDHYMAGLPEPKKRKKRRSKRRSKRS